MDYHRANGVNVRIVRIFNTYGPRMHPYDGRVISNFIRQALEGEDIAIFGDGRQTRSFCYRDDLVEGLIRMMNAPDDFCGPVNLGNPEEFTIRQLADIVLELTGSGSKLVARPLPADDPAHGGPTLRSLSSGWAGNRRSPCARGWPRRSTGSARSTCPSIARRRRIINLECGYLSSLFFAAERLSGLHSQASNCMAATFWGFSSIAFCRFRMASSGFLRAIATLANPKQA